MRFSTKPRISAASVSASSLMPRSSTVWPRRGRPASASRAIAALAAGDDDLPDLRPAFDIGEGSFQGLRWERAKPLRPDHLAAEAEAAINGAGVQRLQEHAVGITVDNALDGAVRRVADRVLALAWVPLELALIRHELPCDRVGGISRVDQRRHLGRDRDG